MGHGAPREPGAEIHHAFDMGLVAAHQNEITRLRAQCHDLLTALHDIEQAAEWGLPGEDARDRLGKISTIAQDAIRKAKP